MRSCSDELLILCTYDLHGGIPRCGDGMAMAHEFLKSCVSALESCQSANFDARFESYMRHRAECEQCNGV